MVLRSLSKPVDEEILEYLYYDQVKGMKMLSEDIAHYNRLEEGHPERSYDYLVKCVERQLRLTRQAKTRVALSRGLIGNPNEEREKHKKVPAGAAPTKLKKLKPRAKSVAKRPKGAGNRSSSEPP